jgi:mRNA interferase MazF
VNRGDIFIVIPPSPFNKPRPSLVIQSGLFPRYETVTVALITSDLSRNPGIRVPIMQTAENGLRKPSEIVIDNIQTLPVNKVRDFVGAADAATMKEVDAAIKLFLDLP